MSDLIQALKDNKNRYFLMSEKLRIKADEIGFLNFRVLGFVGDEPKFIVPGSGGFRDLQIYQLRPDYAEKPKVVECDVFVEDGHLHFRLDNSNRHSLGQACDHPDFVGFRSGKYLYGRLYREKGTGLIQQVIKVCDLELYSVLPINGVLFKGATK